MDSTLALGLSASDVQTLSLSLSVPLSAGSSSDGDFRVSLIREIHVGITSASDLRETKERLNYASQAGLARAAK